MKQGYLAAWILVSICAPMAQALWLEDWRLADQRWRAFWQVRLAALSEPRVAVETQHALLQKHMPRHRVYGDRYQTYVLTADGTVYAHGERSVWPADPPWCRLPACEVRDASAILEAAGLKVLDAEAAVQVIGLFRVITSNGNLPSQADLFESYRAVAERVGRREWQVRLVHTGPASASVFAQPHYRILTGMDGAFVELRETWPDGPSAGRRQ